VRVFILFMLLILKRVMACMYELLILIAIWMLVTWLFVFAFGDATSGEKRWLLQAMLWLVTGAYFVVCWVRTGQTLAMQVWKMKVVQANGQLLTYSQAIQRYVLASILMLAFGLDFIYMLFNPKRLFLHDRILNTQYLLVSKSNG
jgi:uncharacterized RDD family membrane protein YckC